jgi:hypothetical protein
MGEKVKGIAHEVVLSVAQKERNRFRPNTVGKVCIFDYAKKKESLSAINVLLAVGLEKERALGILDKHYDEKAFTLDARRSNEGYSQWYNMETIFRDLGAKWPSTWVARTDIERFTRGPLLFTKGP